MQNNTTIKCHTVNPTEGHDKNQTPKFITHSHLRSWWGFDRGSFNDDLYKRICDIKAKNS